MTTDRIDENGLPIYAPGDYDYVRVVDRATGASRNALAPEVTAAARALSEALDGLVQNARDDIEDIIRDLGYLAPVPYASGLNVNDIKFTVSYNGDVYAPKPELVPFTTGAWNPDQWNVIQGDINLRSDLADPTGGGALVAFRPGVSVASKLDELRSPIDFTGTVDQKIEALNADAADYVFIPKDYAGTTYLHKQAYGPGRVMVGGLNSASNNATGKAMVRAPFSGLTPHHPCAVTRLDDTTFRVFLHLGGKVWQVCDFRDGGLDAAGRPTPLGWWTTTIQDITEAIVNGDAAVTKTGTWSELTSSDPSAYIGHKAALSAVAGDYVEIAIDGDGGDVSVVFTGRTNGAYVQVQIDGDDALVNTLPTHTGGYKYFDSYTAVDLSHRQEVLIAKGLPAGEHTIRLTIRSDKNPSAGAGNRFLFNAVTLAGAGFGRPWSENARPKPWLPNHVYAQFEECVGHNSRVYVATTGGISGTVRPSHTSGSATDGSVTWLRLNRSSFESQSTSIQLEGSQTEYAYEFAPTGQSPRQDVGGNLHGNEYRTSLRIIADGVEFTPEVGEYSTGRSISIVQKVVAYYGTAASHTKVADTSLAHHFGGGKVVIAHSTKFAVAGSLGFHYPAMWPLAHYHNTPFTVVFEHMETPQAGRYLIRDAAGLSNPLLGRTRDYQMHAIGEIYRPRGEVDNPSEGPGQYKIVATLTVEPSAVGEYSYARNFAAMAANVAGRAAAIGHESWPVKMYFQRSSGGATSSEPITAGQVIESSAEYHIGLFAK